VTAPLHGMRLLLIHAHPDDEALFTGGTIAACAARGADVRVLTCTLGEEGEVIGEEFAQLVAARADQLGGYRIHELSRALAALSAPGRPLVPTFLGGAGHWRDSGMAGTPSTRHPRAFANADFDEAVGMLAAEICGFAPHVVVTYDPAGTYGHPDHIQVHRISTAAIERAATAREAAWDVPKTYWCVTPRSRLESAISALADFPPHWRRPAPGELAAVPDAEVTAAIGIGDVLEAKRASLRAHATQVSVAPDGASYALSNNIAQPLLDHEYFTLVRGAAGDLGADGLERDLFSGVAAVTPSR
jgi:N-acetyl-1-D-myo-inositol-2-amino-2-deoxy-alpha-D-glucopyranoside deacetylase